MDASLAVTREKTEEIVTLMRKFETLPKIEKLLDLLVP
jgi:hypothetical protein